ncbi:MAG: InlB B-repeat-containing protein, partial [Kiritimatiellae bacterium]|nr:InlB B-repeat-containing protein [Kiritimatiellia bacterium]
AVNQGTSKYPNWCNAYIVERKSNGEQFYVVMFTGSRFDKGSYLTYGGYLSARANLGPWLLVALPYNGALYTSSSYTSIVASNLSSSYTRAPNASGTGAIFSKKHDTLSTSGVSVPQATLGFGGEPAALATVTYQRSLTVTFNDYDGSTIDTSTVLEGNDATPPADPSRTGWHFTGWSGSYLNVQSIFNDTATTEINTYTVRFLDYDGSVIDTQTIAHGSDATPPADPTREGWRFTGWQGDYTGITAATDITATYVESTAVTYWVAFLDWDNTQLSRQEIVEGEDATPPADPDNRPGWHFTGWQGNYTAVAQDETVTAQYAINTYVVTFQDWDGTELKTETVEHGSDATPPANPSRTGWHFTGWSGVYQNVQAATTITAQYEIDTFTVTFQYTNGTVIATQTVEYLGSATKPADPAPLDDTTVFYKWQGKYTSVTNDVDVLAIFVPKVIEIGTGAEFAEYLGSDLMGMSAITLALTNDISLSGVSHSGGQLVATIDGRGHTVSNIPSSFKMFSDIRGGTVRDIVFKGFRSPGNANRTSLIASSSYSGTTLSGVVFDDCKWTVSSASYGTSAMIYEVKQNTLMTNCVMRNCSVLGASAGGGGQYIGGFVAIASSLRMVDCHFIVDNTNTVAVGDGIHVAGAFIGKCDSNVAIEKCSNNARVKVAKNAGEEGGAGGFVGVATVSGSPTIRDCANFGTVESTVPAYPAGGFIGDVGTESGTFSLTVQSCFNYGAVSSPIAAGGLVGRYRGVVSTLRNNGNSGAVSSEAGAAGGFVGSLRYNAANKTFGICNALQAGAISTASGCAGLLVGGIEESDLVGLTMSVSNTWIAGSAAISDGGQAGILFGGRDITAENELTIVLGESKVLESNASLPPYYDKDNAPKDGWESTPPPTFAASMLNDQPIRKSLNAYAATNNYTAWIRGHDYPELATFGTECKRGFFIIVR